MMKLIFKKIIIGSSIFMAACQAAPNSTETVVEKLNAAQITTQQDLLQLQDLLQPESCKKDSHCAVVGTHPMPCGGYNRYWVYSTTHTEEKIVKKLVARINGKIKQHQKKQQLKGICVHKPAPLAQCVSGKCRELITQY